MSEWKEYKLGEIASFKTGKLNSNVAVNNGVYPFFTCSPETLRINDFAFDQEAILLAGNNAEGNFNIKYYIGKFNAYQRTYIISGNEGIDNKFLFYALSICLKHFKAYSQGTATKFLTAGILNNFRLSIPKTLLLQRRIASILSSLDDKIVNNRRICENLEAQAQALFKHWFIDFAPFKNGNFVESELGMIPEGWRVGKVQDLSTNMASGGTPSSMNREYYGGDIMWFSTKELNDGFLFDSEKHITIQGLNNSSAKLFPQNTVLMAIYAAPTVGRLGILSHRATFNQAAVGIVAKEEFGYEFVYLLLLSERKNLNNLACGAAQQNLNVGIVKNYKCIIPSNDSLSSFKEFVAIIFKQLKELQKESSRLATLRDTLLPKLMSGQIKL